MNNTEEIERLKKELVYYSEKDDLRLKSIKDQAEIKELKKKIREKKYGGIVQAGKNVGVISKNIYGVGKQVTKGLGEVGSKFVGEDTKQSKKKKVKTINEIMKELPQ